MHRERFRRTKLVGLLGAGAFVLLCALSVHSVLLHGQAVSNKAKSAEQGKQASVASAAQPTAEEQNDSDSLAEDDDGPSPGNFLGSTYVPSINATNALGGIMAAAPPPPTPVPADAGGDAARQKINDETASLLAMVYALKDEVDRTNKDTLSISVVRKAGQIEQLARKVRDDMRPGTSRN